MIMTQRLLEFYDRTIDASTSFRLDVRLIWTVSAK